MKLQQSFSESKPALYRLLLDEYVIVILQMWRAGVEGINYYRVTDTNLSGDPEKPA